MALTWDPETASFVDDAADPMPSVTPPKTTPAPAPAAPAKKDGWSGGFWSDLKHVVSRVPEEAGQIGRSLPQLPGQLANEVNDALSFLTGGYSDKGLEALEKVDPTADAAQAGGGIPGLMSVGQRQQSEGPKTASELTPSNVLQAPIVRLLPGAYTVDKAVNDPAALAEHPLQVGLDLLPYVGKAGKVATKGSAFAESAANRAAGIGRVAKAERIAEQGMKLPEIVQEATRRMEARAVEKFPSMYGKTPSALMERAGLGGERLRTALQGVGSRSRAFTKEVAEEQKRILDGAAEWEKQGIDSRTQSRLLAEAETADRAWWAQRSDAERGFLNWFRERSDEMFDRYEKTFEFGGERYTRAQAPSLYRHVKRIETIRKWGEGMERRLDPAHPKHPRSPEAVENLAERRAKMGERLTAAEQAAGEAAQTAYPARFSRVINERMRPGVEELVETSRRMAEAEGAPLPLPDEMIANLLESGSYRQLQRAGVISDAGLKGVARGISETWQELRASGLDPMYHHHVVGPRRARLAAPRFDPIHLLREPSAIKRRGWDMEPWVPEASVSLIDQAVDLVQAKHASAWLDDMRSKGMLKSAQEVTTEVGNAAHRIVRDMPVERQAAALPEIIQQLQDQLYEQFTPGRGLSAPKMVGGAESVYIPKGIAGVLGDITKPPKLPPAARIPMRVFRASVLYLNPGYYIGNSIGNSVMLSARGSPADLRYFPKALNAWRKGELPIEISMGSVLGTADESFKAGLHKMGWEAIDDLDASVWSKTADRAGKAEAFLQRFAGALDDMTKATAYFAEYEKALKAGKSGDLAIARAVEHMNKVNMGFDTLLPMERAVMRGVLMPFYSWTKFALGYIMSYPFDHPWRAAVINSLSNQIREEWDERLPERFMGYWAVGTTKDGKTKLYPTGGIYPFQSFFSTNDIWTGALRRMAPILQVAQQYSGIDPFSGSPDPYLSYHDENWKYDPVSGKPAYVRPGLGKLLTEAYLPHAEIFFNSVDDKQQEYYRKNPGRYFEDLMRSLGITVPMTRDLGEEAQKAAEAQDRFGEEPTPATVAAAPAPAPADNDLDSQPGLTWDPETASFK